MVPCHPVPLIFLHRRNTQLVIVDIPCGTKRGEPYDGRDVTVANPTAPPVHPLFPGKAFRIHKHLRAVPFPFHVCIGHHHAPSGPVREVYCPDRGTALLVLAFCAAVSLKGSYRLFLPAPAGLFLSCTHFSTCLSKMFYPQSPDRRLGNSIIKSGNDRLPNPWRPWISMDQSHSRSQRESDPLT